jgi:hypothetical protein
MLGGFSLAYFDIDSYATRANEWLMAEMLLKARWLPVRLISKFVLRFVPNARV